MEGKDVKGKGGMGSGSEGVEGGEKTGNGRGGGRLGYLSRDPEFPVTLLAMTYQAWYQWKRGPRRSSVWTVRPTSARMPGSTVDASLHHASRGHVSSR